MDDNSAMMDRAHTAPEISRLSRRPSLRDPPKLRVGKDFTWLGGVAGGLAGGHLAGEGGAGGAGGSFSALRRANSRRNAALARDEVAMERRASRLQSGAMELAEETGLPPEPEQDIAEELSKLPKWQSTLTVRALFIAAILGAAFSIISLKLGLTTGVIPSLNIGAGLLGYFLLGVLSKSLGMLRINGQPMTAQEVTVVQTCVVACYGMAFNGGFGTYLIAMDQQSYENVGVGVDGNRPEDVVNPTLARSIGYMFCIALFGLFMLVPLRRQLIISYELPYPSGTATGLMINSFFTRSGGDAAKRQLRSMGKWFAFSFIFDFWKWFFTGNGDCGTVTGGFGSFPTFGLQALDWSWNFDFSQNYVGVGMLCPQIVSWSIMFGAIISWGIMWPLISKKEGEWYPAGLPSTSLEGLYAYKVFIAIAVFIADGIYIVFKLGLLTYLNIQDRRRAAAAAAAAAADEDTLGPAAGSAGSLTAGAAAVGEEGGKEEEGLKGPGLDESESEASDGGHKLMAGETEFERELRRTVFSRGAIPWWVGVAGYIGMLAVAVGAIPQLYSQAKWYHVLVAGLVAPPLAFANAYGAGLTDWNMASLYGKLAIFIFAAWAGLDSGGVIAGLAVCGVVFSSVASASDLMQDFRTGYLTLSSPRAMFVAQLAGAVMGCIIAPCCFWMFWSAFPIGEPGSLYSAPYATVYRAMAVVGVEGLSVLPQNCMALCGGFIGVAIAFNLLRDFLPSKYARFVPLPMCMALPFYLGAWLAVDMCIGAVIMLVWGWANSADCQLLSAAVASGLIAGDGIWTIPSAILAMSGVNPPICMGWAKANNGR